MSPADEASSDYYDRVIEFVRTDNGQRITVIVYSLIATIVLLALPNTIAAYAFGIPFIFFVPGFMVVRMFFWKGTSAEAKFVLSLGLSILVVIFLGLILVLTPIGLTSNSTRASLVLFALAAVAAETFVLRADRGEKPEVPQKREPEKTKTDVVVAAMLVTALAVSAISLGLIITAEYPSRTYFALTDDQGMIVNNTTFTLGTNFSFILHMKNGEDGPRTFTLVAYGLDTPAFGTQTFLKTMDKGETWNQTTTVHFGEAGYFRLDFDLYIQEDSQPPYLYGNLHLWIGVFPSASVVA
jgi:uncharacterized membrane protein